MEREVLVAKMDPKVEQNEPVTQENFLEHPDTSPKALHEWAKGFNFDDSDQNDHELALKHPNMPTDALHHVFEATRPRPSEAGDLQFRVANHHSNILEQAMKHPNFSARDAEQYLRDVSAKPTDGHSEAKGLMQAAASHPGVDRQVLKDITTQAIADPAVSWNDYDASHLQNMDPDYLVGLLGGSGQWQPETRNMTESQKANNNRINKIHRSVMSGLTQTNLHTPENTAAVIRSLHDTRPEGITNEQHNDFFAKYVAHNPHLTSQQLESIFASSKPDKNDHYDRDHEELRENILDHPSVDPGFLARVVFAGPKDPMVRRTASGSNFDDLKARAIMHPRFPEEAKKKLIAGLFPGKKGEPASYSASVRQAMANAPTVTSDDRRKMYEGGVREVLYGNEAPQDLLREVFHKDREKNLKDPQAGRDLLQMKNLPPDVLKELVGHKNMNVAVEALEHPNVDKDVVEAAVKRKARKVTEAGIKHPLASQEHVLNNLKEGKTSAHDLIFGSEEPSRRRRWDRNSRPEFDLTPDVANAVGQHYSGFSDENVRSMEGDDDEAFGRYLKVKKYLATKDGVPAEVRNQSAKDISDKFLDVTKKDVPDSHVVRNLTGTVIEFANSGDKHARDAALARPDTLNQLKLEDPEVYDGQYLDQVAQNAPKIKDESARRGVYRDIVQNANASDELFDKIITDPEFLRDKSNYSTSSWNDYSNAIDSRVMTEDGDGDEEEADRIFGKLKAIGTDDATEAIVRSRSAPVADWDEAWHKLPDDRKEDIISSNLMPHLLSDREQKRKALTGGYDVGVSNPKNNAIRRAALGALDADDPDDRALLQDFLSHQAVSGHEHSPDSMASDLGNGFYKPEHVKEMTDSLTSRDEKSNLNYGMAYAKEAAGRTSMEDPQAVAKYVDYAARQGLDRLPEAERGDALANRWVRLLTGNDVSWPEKARKAADSKSLDYLANLPTTSPELSEKVRSLALQRGLLSQDVRSGLTIGNPYEFGMIMRDTRGSDKATVAQDALSVGKMDPGIVKTIAAHMDHNMLLPPDDYRYGRNNRTNLSSDQKAAQVQHAAGMLDRFISHAVAADAVDSPATAIKSLIAADSRPQSGGFYQDELGGLISGMVDRLNQESAAGNHTAAKALIEMNSSLSASEKEKLPKNFLKAVLDSAVKMTDVGQLVSLSEAGVKDPRIEASISRAMKAPEALSDSSLIDLQGVASKADSFKTFKAVMDESLRRGSTSSPMMAATVFNMGESFSMPDPAHNLRAAETTRKNAYLVDNLIAAQNHPDVDGAAAAHLLDQSRTGTVLSAELAKKAWLGIKDSDSREVDLRHDAPLSDRIVNDPDVVESAQSGWRLKCLMRSYDDFSPDTATVVTNRVMNSDLSSDDKGWYAAKLISRDGVKQEDVVKIARSVGPNSVVETMSEIASQGGHSRLDESSLHHLADLAVADLGDSLEGKVGIKPGGQPYDPEHSMNVLGRISKIASTVSRYQRSPNAKDSKLKNEKIDGLADAAISGLDRTIGEIAQRSMSYPASMTDQIKDSVSNTLKAFFSKGWEDTEFTQRVFNEQQSMKLLDLCSKMESLPSSDDPERAGARKAKFLKGWVKAARVSDGDWQRIHHQHPEVAVALSTTKGFSVAAVSAINPERLHESSVAMNHVIDDVMKDVMSNASPYGRSDAYPKMMRDALDLAQRMQAPGYANYAMAVTDQTIMSAPQHVSFGDIKKLEALMGPDSVREKIYPNAMLTGAGGRELLDHVMKIVKKDPEGHSSLLESAASSPHITPAHASFLIDNASEQYGPRLNVMENLAKNKATPTEILTRLAEGEPQHQVLTAIAVHPSVDRKQYDHLFNTFEEENASSIFRMKTDNPALRNPAYGAEMLNSIGYSKQDKDEMTKMNVTPSKLIDVAEHSTSHERLRQALRSIPAEGISWVDFKHANKHMENLPEIRKLFEGKLGTNDKVMPEDVAATMKAYPTNSFGVSYTTWKGAQRHNPKGANLVMQVNTSGDLQAEMLRDPKMAQVFQFVQNAASYSSHPVNPHTIGWTRIDTSGGNDGWVIEEFQSDFSSRLRNDIEHITKDAQEKMLEAGVHVTPEEMMGYVQKIEKIVSGWYHASLRGAEELAKKHGVKNLYIHGQHVRASLSGMDAGRSYPVKLTEMYHKEPPKFGYEECEYTDYPSWSESMLSQVTDAKPNDPTATKCWRKRLQA